MNLWYFSNAILVLSIQRGLPVAQFCAGSRKNRLQLEMTSKNTLGVIQQQP